MSAALAEVARIVQRESGIELGPSQFPSLRAAIARVDRCLTPEALLDPALSPEVLGALIDEITIRETFFFRHRAELDAIDWYALLDTARAHGSGVVRVWVAGCASGEEAYTVAILACEAFACSSAPVRVLGTDIAPTALVQAVRGRYGERAVRAVDAGVRERYFISEDGASRVGERLRGLVEFRRHNLVRDPFPPAGEQPFDVIMCRNVLIYFDRPTVERVVGALEGALAPAGLLLLGAADRLSGQGLPVSQVRRLGAGNAESPRVRAPLRRAFVRAPGRGGASDDFKRPPGRGDRAAGRERPPGLGAAGADRGRAARDADHERAAAGAGEPIRRPGDSRSTPADAMRAADRGELDLAVRVARNVLAEDPLSSEAHFIRGVAELARENARAALDPLRRALYIDPNFALAAFKLACAHDALGESAPARRAYERTLRTLDHCGAEQAADADRFDLLDMTVACQTRLRELAAQGPLGRAG